jgi:organic radical activating enzyme
MVEGKTFTSNTTKLLKHLDKLKGMQEGRVSPVMVHIAPTNVCNLTCDYCCYGQRPLRDKLTPEQIESALAQFRELGTLGVEWTGGGDPSMYRDIDRVIRSAQDLGYKQGLITNAVDFRYLSAFDALQWMRTSFHGLNVGKTIDDNIEAAKSANPELEISGVYIWTKDSEKTIGEVARLADKYGIPTRVTPDLTLGVASIDEMMPYVAEQVRATGSDQLFISDFNVKTDRRNDHCYMHMVKPFVFSDGNVYVCPSAALSPENRLNVNAEFKVCSIDDIAATYAKGTTMRHHGCDFCKYSQQNELVDDILTETRHNDFA